MSGPPSVQYILMSGWYSCTRLIKSGVPTYPCQAMPSAYFLNPGIVEHAHCAPPQAAVVIEQPDFGVKAFGCDLRTEVIAHEVHFEHLWPHRRRHLAALVGIDFILRSDRVDRYSRHLVSLQ